MTGLELFRVEVQLAVFSRVLALQLSVYPDKHRREGSAHSPAGPSPLPAVDSIIDIPALHPVQKIAEPRVPYPNQQIPVPRVVVPTQEVPGQHV